VKVLEDTSRGIERDASGCTRAEEAEEAVEVVVVETVVEMVVETVAAETTGVETMVVMAERVMTGVGMMVVREGKTEEYAKEREQDRENRKSKEGKLKGGINREKRTDIPHPQNLTHNSHIVSNICFGWVSFGYFKIKEKSKA
jgi:hypothetical protein